MPGYRFTIHGDQAPKPIEVSLPDDTSAWDYGENIMRLLLRRDGAKCEGWTMNITEGSRNVANIAFGLEALQERKTQH